MLKKYQHSFCGRLYRGARPTHYKGEKPIRINNESDKDYSNRIALHEYSIPPISTFEKWRDAIVGYPVIERHNLEGEQHGEIRSLYLDYQKDGTADVYVNADLSEKGLELAKKYGGLSLGYMINQHLEGTDDKFMLKELSLTPNPRIKGCMITGIKNSELDNIEEMVIVHLSIEDQEKNKKKMSEKVEDTKVPEPEKTIETTQNYEIDENSDIYKKFEEHYMKKPVKINIDGQEHTVTTKFVLETGSQELPRKKRNLDTLYDSLKNEKIIESENDLKVKDLIFNQAPLFERVNNVIMETKKQKLDFEAKISEYEKKIKELETLKKEEETKKENPIKQKYVNMTNPVKDSFKFETSKPLLVSNEESGSLNFLSSIYAGNYQTTDKNNFKNYMSKYTKSKN